jgi:hypothetical protein
MGDKFECCLHLQGRAVEGSISGFWEILHMSNELYGVASRYTVILKFPCHLKCLKFGRTEITCLWCTISAFRDVCDICVVVS